METIVVTGGAGFIGGNFVRYYLAQYPEIRVRVLDSLTYAADTATVRAFADAGRIEFIHGSICDPDIVKTACAGADAIINFAAETHVDRSILDAGAFLQTDIAGVHTLLEFQRASSGLRLLHVSTDEVYGSIPEGLFVETDPFRPNSPYSASKAGGELMARAYHVTYNADVVVTRASNTFGPYQYPEKMLSLFITNLIDDIPVPVYGDGQQVRDWLAVEDHCKGIDIALRRGKAGEAYNIGGGNERTNMQITQRVMGLLSKGEDLIRHVPDRPGHDFRYALDSAKLAVLGFQPKNSFEDDLAATVDWYQTHESWWRPIKLSPEYIAFNRRWYGAKQSTPSAGD